MTKENPKISIVWFRQDLRLSDNPALKKAVENGSVMPIFIFNTTMQQEIGHASQWWLHNSLQKLNESLDKKLNFYIGKPEEILTQLTQKFSIDNVYCNTVYEPEKLAQDTLIVESLKKAGVTCSTFSSQLLWQPTQLVKEDGTPYKVYTPFYRNAYSNVPEPTKPTPAPKNIELFFDDSNTTTLNDFKLITNNQWTKRLEETWNVGEKAAQKRISDFIKSGLDGYQEKRNFPNLKNVSRLSPHLHFGEASSNQAWHAALESNAPRNDISCFLSELGWREFSYNLLYFFPELPEQNFQKKFDNFPWEKPNKDILQAWKDGKTGYPIVDAGMRELAQTGYMHNRVRMIVASFLIKNLLIHWHYGRDWFWECLVDADLANNSASWQWVAGSGADAAPYFRIFNPVLQGEKFDKEGEYTRKYVPELASMPNKYLFQPWLAPQDVLKKAKISLGKDYPLPIVDIKASRDKALDSYSKI